MHTTSTQCWAPLLVWHTGTDARRRMNVLEWLWSPTESIRSIIYLFLKVPVLYIMVRVGVSYCFSNIEKIPLCHWYKLESLICHRENRIPVYAIGLEIYPKTTQRGLSI
jgi:hypothetical protein